MPLRLPIKKQLTARSDRVKSVDIFPGENPWVLAALYSGNVYIWDYATNTMIKSFETGNNPVRCAKFVVRKQWVVAGTDDMKLRVFNYNTMDKVKEWDAHNDYIRFIEVHPNRPFIISSSDDMSIKLWDWEKDFDCTQIFEGHSHYVMMVRINPRDTNTFASASLDKTIKVWSLTTGSPHFSLEGHEKGVNCIDYYPGGDKPYLISGADDRTIKIWDYQTKACLQTLEGHSHNVSSVCFHPRLPVVLSASEDGTVRLWHATTYRPETTLNYGLERAWCIAVTKDSNKIAIGYDEGTIVLKLGNERPVASLDINSAKLIWAHGHDIQTISLKGLSKPSVASGSADSGAAADAAELADGERISLNTRDLGACEVYPQHVQHNSNGSFIVVCGDGEYIIYTSQALRNKAFGSALDFVWSALASGDFAIRESVSRVRTFKNFKEHKTLALPISSADALYGGAALGVKGPDCVVFFDWEDGAFIRKIDVLPTAVYWNEAGDSLVIATTDAFFVLKYDRDVVAAALSASSSSGGNNSLVNGDEGVEGSFELVTTINERVVTGQWVGECFLFTTDARKLNYVVGGGQVMTLAHLNHSMYLLGFVPKEDRVFLVDKAFNVVSYRLRLSVLSYQTAVVRKDFVTANALLALIPPSEYAGVARFLESQGFKEEALAVTTDNDQKFELAIELKRMEIAHDVLRAEDASIRDKQRSLVSGGGSAAETTSSSSLEDSTDTQSKWRRLGDLALMNGDLALAEACALRSQDLSGLLLLYSSTGNLAGMRRLAVQAREAGRLNVAFVASFITGRVEDCLSLLVEHNRLPEAALLARTYLPSKVSGVLELWKGDLKKTNEKAAEALADPIRYPNLFADFDIALKVEEMFLRARENVVPASMYLQAKADLDLDLIALVKQQLVNQAQQVQQSIDPVVTANEPPSAPTEDKSFANEESESEEQEEVEKESSSPKSPPRLAQSVPSTVSPIPVSPAAQSPQRSASPPTASVGLASSSPPPTYTTHTSTTAAVPSASSSPEKRVGRKPSKDEDEEEADVQEEEEENDDEEDIDALLAEEEKLLKEQIPSVSNAKESAEEDDDDLNFDNDEEPTSAIPHKHADATAAADDDDVDFDENEDW